MLLENEMVSYRALQVVSKNCYNTARTESLFWIHLLDMQGVGTYLFIDFLFLTV